MTLRVLETALYAGDLAAAARFYQDVLGLTPIGLEDGRHVFFRCGEGVLLIFNPSTTIAGKGPVPPHGALGPGHAAFAIDDDQFDAWSDRLERHGVEIEARIDWPAGGRSLYFRDPAGNSLELATPATWGRPD